MMLRSLKTALPSALAILGMTVSANAGVVAHYPFSGNANDVSGNGHHGTLHGPVLTEDPCGTPDSAYHFDGVDDFIELDNGVKPPFPLTVSVWMNLDSLGESQYLFRNDHVDDAANRYGLALGVQKSGHATVSYYEGFSTPSNRVTKVSHDPVAEVGEWHMFSVVISAHQDIRLYWDGSEIPGSYEGTGSGMRYSGGNGAIGNLNTPTRRTHVHGVVDEVRVYDHALSAVELQSLYEEPCAPSSGLTGHVLLDGQPPLGAVICAQEGEPRSWTAISPDGSFEIPEVLDEFFYCILIGVPAP